MLFLSFSFLSITCHTRHWPELAFHVRAADPRQSPKKHVLRIWLAPEPFRETISSKQLHKSLE
jgi:hypothetical protein